MTVHAKPYSPQTLAERFLPLVRKAGPDECWLWTGPVMRTGYGNAGSWFHHNIGTVLPHRLAYLLSNGSLPKRPLMVRHKCDNRLCCNPNHLLPGTNTDNMRDMVERGRSCRGRKHSNYGETHPCAKINDAAVALIFELRKQGLTHDAIGSQVGASPVQIGRILKGTSRAAR